jgi:membrane-associated phospholipid phosphatase
VDTSDQGRDGLRNRRGLDLRPPPVALLVVAWVTLAGILMGIGMLVVHSGTVQGFDNHVTSVVVAHRSPVLNAAMKTVTWLGSWVAELVAAGVVLFLVLRHRLSVGFLILAVVSWAGVQGGTTLAKHVVERPRPPEHVRLVSAHGWSWPSGHTSTATVVFAVLATIVWVLNPRAGPRLLAALGWTVAVIAVAFSRVELGVHWTTDVLASVIFVVAWLLVLGVLFGSAVVADPNGASVPPTSIPGDVGGSPSTP